MANPSSSSSSSSSNSRTSEWAAGAAQCQFLSRARAEMAAGRREDRHPYVNMCPSFSRISP
eukprot:12904760-Heterocapsa_arctica.AAC.1